MKKLLFLSALLISAGLFPQQWNVDSLLKVWKNPALPDTIRCQAMNYVIWDSYMFSQPDSSIYYAYQVLNYAKKKDLKKIEVKTCNQIGVAFDLKGDIPTSIQWYEKALAIARKENFRKNQASILNNLGSVYQNLGYFTKSMQYINAAYNLAHELKLVNVEADCLNNIGTILHEIGEKEKGLMKFKEALALRETIGDKLGIANALDNIGSVLFEQRKYADALDYHQKALAIQESIDDINGMGFTLVHQANVMTAMGELDKALELLKKSLALREKMKDEVRTAFGYQAVGEFYYSEKNDPTNALLNLSRAYDLAKKCGAAETTSDAAKTLYRLYKEKGDFKKALLMYKEFNALRDSLGNENIRKELVKKETLYELERGEILKAAEKKLNEQILAEEEEEKQLIRTLGVLFFIVILFATLLLIRKRKVSLRFIRIFGTFSVLVLFEFVSLLLHPYIIHFTNHHLVFTFMCLIGLALIIVPLHHRIEHWIMAKLDVS